MTKPLLLDGEELARSFKLHPNGTWWTKGQPDRNAGGAVHPDSGYLLHLVSRHGYGGSSLETLFALTHSSLAALGPQFFRLRERFELTMSLTYEVVTDGREYDFSIPPRALRWVADLDLDLHIRLVKT
jgi:hypothetical protein